MPLTTLILEATTPPTINENTFSNINHSTTITIPEGCKGAYLSDPNWKYLLNLTSGKVDGTIGYEQNLTWTLTFADSTLTISGTGKMDYISSEESWEAYKDYIATVIIKDGVTSIASNAFYNHRNLKEITIPNSVTSIESYAFNETAIYNNENNWTNGILYIGDCLIDTNYDLNGNYVIIPGTRIIANGAFANKNITGITIPNSVKAIGEEAFFKCQALTTINVQATTPPTISYSTFIGISSSVIITIPEDCETAYTADQNWRMLIDMTTGKVTGTIGYEQKLTWTLTFADSTLTISGTGSMEYIDYETSWKRFYPSIATVVIKDGVASIAHGAFSSHSNLREITIPNSVINIGNGAFNETAIYNNENNWTNGGLYIKNCLVATREWEMDETGYFTIADGTRLIADEAFSYNSRLTTITIPNSVTHIGNRILYGCGNITSINVLATTPPVITSSTFEGVSTGIQVTIPEGSTALYEADTNWNNFLGFCSGILSGTCGENLTWTLILADNTLNISGTGEMADYEGNNPQPWQQYRSYINTINIADGVTSIGTNAFANCYNLTNINIPNSINHIGANALWNTQLYYDKSKWTNGVLYINNCLIKASNEASGDYTIVEGTRIIADDAFYDYYESDSLTSIILPNSITHIGKRAFYNRQIENVHIGSGTQFIGDEAFAYCENLSVINVAAATPPVITDQTFYRISTNLQITVPAGSESLYLADPNWKRLFDIASGVVEGVCGDHLTWVLNLADSTLTISGYGDMYDYDVWNDETYFPMPWEEFIYDNIKNIILPDGITSIGDFAFLNDSYNMTSIHLPEGIRRIGKYAFAGNYGLTSISIPASVELIDTAAFYYCTELTAVQVNSNNRHYCSENGVLFNKDKSTLIIYPAKKQDSYYALPSNVKVIETAAFMSCQALTEIILPEGLETINGEAFEYCTNLAKINIPNSVNYIGSWAFDETAIYENENNWTDGALYIDNCLIATDYDFPNNNYDILSGTRLIAGGVFDYSGILEEVTIPASVVSIGEYAFRHCNALKKITILAKNPPMLGRNVFEDVSRSIPVYVPAEALEDYQTAKTWNEFNLQAIPPTALQTPSMPESIRVYGGLLHNPQGLPVSIYDMQGRRVYSGTAATVSQPAGMYVLRCGGASRKVLF